jgi:hypothetical protein
MNAKEQIQVNELYSKIETVEKHNIKLYYRMEKVLGLLEDDSNSNTKGLISKVNDLDSQVEKLIVMNSAIKKASVFLITILGGLVTYAAKLVFFK